MNAGGKNFAFDLDAGNMAQAYLQMPRQFLQRVHSQGGVGLDEIPEEGEFDQESANICEGAVYMVAAFGCLVVQRALSFR